MASHKHEVKYSQKRLPYINEKKMSIDAWKHQTKKVLTFFLNYLNFIYL